MGLINPEDLKGFVTHGGSFEELKRFVSMVTRRLLFLDNGFVSKEIEGGKLFLGNSMTLGITEVKKGMVLKVEGDLYSVVKTEFVNPGKGSAFIRTKLKNLTRNSSIERTFKAAEKLESVELEKRNMTICYTEGNDIIFMDSNDFEQMPVSKEYVEDILPFLKEETPMEVTFYEGKPIGVIPPNFSILEVTYAEEGLKGDTSGTAQKRVTVETGGEINVPIFVKQGDVIKIDLRDLTYVERVSK
ncbi:translation elongation factor P [Leptospira kirschneri str. 200801925]|uniref:Elongation factor P n=3 Tax=Leptospira kirschneri TaxID=29507 RepID=A0A828Y4N5_9LEPT|nr:translation elongation factor P [Leptospira kirschneri serovar Grippotyphosa str. RM52]EKO49502.1 translation elongation factor P [Leptospira kirschneri str. 200802841]EMJ91190.1 translation elongation factor P [Leptospira kirschneri str. JB]EMK02165.1 translation elongation factor P [Leptospira kirschneri str. MMD1493]EMK04985.1 translation elongation factor P [Leptospira kirschneri]EMK17702.1 translation elongation factor P [Leptospira kirschneri serovar Bim str. PUO 1247]EMN05758.1 tran